VASAFCGIRRGVNDLSGLADLGADDSLNPIAPDGSPALAALKPPDPEDLARLHRWANSTNIALEEDGPDDNELIKLGALVVREYEIDENSRSEWLEKSEDSMRLAMQIAEPKSYPWAKSSNVIFPLMTTAAIQFAARAYPAIISNKDVVRGVVVGSDDGVPNLQAVAAKAAQAMAQQAQQQPLGQPPQPPAPGVGHNGGPPMQSPQPDPNDPSQWIAGKDGVPQTPGYKQARADRVGEHMSWQLLDEQPEWEPETDQLLHILPIIGCVFRKSFFDADKDRNSSLMVQAKDLCINYKARALEIAPRLTELITFYPLEIKEKELAGTWLEITYPQSGKDGDTDAPILFLEQHRWYDFDDDGYPEPYIVTVHKESQKVVRIVARFELDGIKYNFTKGKIIKIDPVHYYTIYNFLPNTEGGIYGLGFGQLLKSLNASINTTLNMMIDAGHLAVVGGGFIGKGLSMNAGQIRFSPGEWKPVNSPGQSVRDSLVPLPAPGPNPVLFQLLGLLIDAGKEVAGVKDVLTGETVAGNTPATTMLAMVEQGLKVFTAIYKRVHRSLKSELAKLHRLNRLYLDEESEYKTGSEWRKISRADYEKSSGVDPVSDPTMVTDMQKLGKAGFLKQYEGNPLFDQKKIIRRGLEAATIENIDDLFAANPPPNPAIIAKMQELLIKKQTVDMQQAEKEAGLQLRERHDAALIEREQASALNFRAQAVLALANADKAVGQNDVAWATHQLDVIKAAMDASANAGLAGTAAANDPSQEIDAETGQPGAGPSGAGDQMQTSAPPTQPQQQPAFGPPAVAPDGNTYVKHLASGVFHRVDRVAA
jgi:chaperonin GroES